MRALFSSLRGHAPFLFSERGAVSLTRSLAAAGRGGPRSLQPGQDNRGVAAEGSVAEGLDLVEKTVADCALSRATLTAMQMDGGVCSRTHIRNGVLRDVSASGSTWDVVDLEHGTLEDVRAPGSNWCLVSFRDGALTRVDLAGASFVLCDFTRATLTAVDMTSTRLSGVDFRDAVFTGTTFRGADLRGALFQGAWCGDTDFADAAVDGADFRGAGGLSDAVRLDLARRGARIGGGYVRRLWERLLGGDDPVAAQPRVRVAIATTWALVLVLIPLAFFARAILHPVNPDLPPGFEEPQDPAERAPDATQEPTPG